MNDNATIATSPEFEASIARRALLLGLENLSRILPQLDATQSRILQRCTVSSPFHEDVS